MTHLTQCDEAALAGICKAIRKCALGQSVAFAVEEGRTRHLEQGQIVEVPNGSYTVRLYVNGGAVEAGVPAEPTP